MNILHSKKWFPISVSNEIAKISNPLNRFGINNFTHDITFEKGQISILSDQARVCEEYYKNPVPAVCTGEEGRILDAGIYLDCKLKREYSDYLVGVERFAKQINSKHFIHIIEKEQDCQHFYSFAFNIDEIDFLHFSINNIGLLKKFLGFYKSQSREITRQAKLPKNRITLPINNNHHDDILISQDNFLQNIQIKTLLHKITKNPVILTSQQFKCLNFLMKGFSSKEIATHLNLSSRTVDHYLANIRKKLGCTHSKDLVSTYCLEFLS